MGSVYMQPRDILVIDGGVCAINSLLVFFVKPCSALLCDQFIVTISSLGDELFIQPYLPVEAAGRLFFYDASNGPYRPLHNHSDLSVLPNEDILANYSFTSCQPHYPP